MEQTIDMILAMIEQNKTVFMIMAAFIVISIVANIVLASGRKKVRTAMLQQTPDAAKVYLSEKVVSATGGVQVTQVNGETPAFFTEKGLPGFYAAPGVVEVTMSFTRQTGMRKYTTYGPTTRKLEIEANGSYLLIFDAKEETFVFKKKDN